VIGIRIQALGGDNINNTSVFNALSNDGTLVGEVSAHDTLCSLEVTQQIY